MEGLKLGKVVGRRDVGEMVPGTLTSSKQRYRAAANP